MDNECAEHWYKGAEGRCEPCSDICDPPIKTIFTKGNCERLCSGWSQSKTKSTDYQEHYVPGITTHGTTENTISGTTIVLPASMTNGVTASPLVIFILCVTSLFLVVFLLVGLFVYLKKKQRGKHVAKQQTAEGSSAEEDKQSLEEEVIRSELREHNAMSVKGTTSVNDSCQVISEDTFSQSNEDFRQPAGNRGNVTLSTYTGDVNSVDVEAMPLILTGAERSIAPLFSDVIVSQETTFNGWDLLPSPPSNSTLDHVDGDLHMTDDDQRSSSPASRRASLSTLHSGSHLISGSMFHEPLQSFTTNPELSLQSSNYSSEPSSSTYYYSGLSSVTSGLPSEPPCYTTSEFGVRRVPDHSFSRPEQSHGDVSLTNKVCRTHRSSSPHEGS